MRMKIEHSFDIFVSEQCVCVSDHLLLICERVVTVLLWGDPSFLELGMETKQLKSGMAYPLRVK